jgi:hypothetical protein
MPDLDCVKQKNTVSFSKCSLLYGRAARGISGMRQNRLQFLLSILQDNYRCHSGISFVCALRDGRESVRDNHMEPILRKKVKQRRRAPDSLTVEQTQYPRDL